MSDRLGPQALSDVEVFCRVADLGGFSRAAGAMGLAPSVVSRSVARLEARLGTPLFTRTTRRVTLTQEGAVYFQGCREALASIEEAGQAVSGAAGQVAGRLRIAVPTTYGNVRILPRLPAFMARHPAVMPEVHVTNRVIDLVEEGFDLVIRIGEQPPSSLIQRVLETLPIGVFAAPAYLAAHGMPAVPEDIARHRCIGFLWPGVPRAFDFLFRCDGKPLAIAPPPGPVIAHDPMGMVALGLAGGGLFQTGHYVVQEHLDRGTLIEVLADHAGATRSVVALYPPNRRFSARLRAFLGFFRDVGAGQARTP
ncbi:LysR family transcriptional regulator [Roseomonas sp. CCTCC AB2023176]|uniref:LysR family transcriptional regulator n=1 Tax=Roseomonas sp. CCTCC AB2023176 TaxID=3342640 RepID=UPI0035DA99B1